MAWRRTLAPPRRRGPGPAPAQASARPAVRTQPDQARAWQRARSVPGLQAAAARPAPAEPVRAPAQQRARRRPGQAPARPTALPPAARPPPPRTGAPGWAPAGAPGQAARAPAGAPQLRRAAARGCPRSRRPCPRQARGAGRARRQAASPSCGWPPERTRAEHPCERAQRRQRAHCRVQRPLRLSATQAQPRAEGAPHRSALCHERRAARLQAHWEPDQAPRSLRALAAAAGEALQGRTRPMVRHAAPPPCCQGHWRKEGLPVAARAARRRPRARGGARRGMRALGLPGPRR